jgi:hypothetical protein
MSVLDAEGIDYYIVGEHFAHFLYNAVPFIFRVPADQLEHAMEALDDLDLAFLAYIHDEEVPEGEEEEEGGE